MSKGPEGGRGGTRIMRDLDGQEIDDLLRRNYWGVLALSRSDEPYGVPIIYGYDGAEFVFASAPGRKVDTLRVNPKVTLTIVEAEEYGKQWRSVIVSGTVHWVDDLPAKIAALDTLRRQLPHAPRRARDESTLAAACIARIVPIEITGRAAGS